VPTLSLPDRIICGLDQALRTVFGPPPTTERDNPSSAEDEADLAEHERKLAARLMRVNHTGEICAQALYQGQAATAKLESVRGQMQRAADEENDHLAWCEQRIEELGSHTSVLNPLFYAGSFTIGAVAGAVGDKWSLGFVAETEKQVVQHLEGHLTDLPDDDTRSRAILKQMKQDEGRHATTALEAGGARLPLPVRLAMKATSKIMTRTAYWV
jgi:ubiquinone biosynthesis monooxygenase Coq7